MARQPPLDSRSQVSPRAPDGRSGGPGPSIGRVRVTPVRVTLAIALLGGIGFLAYAVIVRDQLQVPLMASGFAIVGLVLGAIAVASVANVIRMGREGRDGAAVGSALVGGLVAVGALMSLAASVIMALIWRSG